MTAPERVARDLVGSAPELASGLRAVWRVARAARTRPQRAAAMLAADRCTALAVAAGWTQAEIARVVGVEPSSVSVRVVRERRREAQVPELIGVCPVPPPPSSGLRFGPASPRRLVGASEVAALVGCQPASVAAWAAARDVACSWTPGRAKRLYDRFEVLQAADRFPLQTHPRWRRRKNIAVPPQNRARLGVNVRPVPDPGGT